MSSADLIISGKAMGLVINSFSRNASAFAICFSWRACLMAQKSVLVCWVIFSEEGSGGAGWSGMLWLLWRKGH
jgi:hypothetical protein